MQDRVEIEQDPGSLIDASGDRLEPEADLATAEIIDPLRDRIGEVGVGLHIVEELGVTLAIDGPRLVGSPSEARTFRNWSGRGP